MSIIVRMSAACWVLLGTSALVGCKQEAWVPRVETPAPAPEPEHPLARELA